MDYKYLKLRNFIIDNMHGGCKIISEGPNCTCPLCLFENLLENQKELDGPQPIAYAVVWEKGGGLAYLTHIMPGSITKDQNVIPLGPFTDSPGRLLSEFSGFICAIIPELHKYEVPKFLAHIKDFLNGRENAKSS